MSLFRPRKVTYRLIDYLGARFIVDLREDVGWLMHSFRNFEDDEIHALSKRIQPSWNCLDIGGNIGLYSVLLAKMAPQGKVVSCEPIQRNVSTIAMNRVLNDVGGETVVALIGDKDGDISFSEPKDSSYASIQDTGRGGALEQTHTMRMTTVDSLVESREYAFDFIKIDIEGAEAMAIRGMTKLLRSSRRPSLLMIEICDENLRAFKSSGQEIVALMGAFGYAAISIDRGHEVPGLVPGKASQNVLFVAR